MFFFHRTDRVASGRTVLLSSHQIAEIERVADTVANHPGQKVMNSRTVVARLAWKEFRQLVPLLVMLPILTLLIGGIVSARELAGGAGGWIVAQTIAVLLIGMPGLYAAGVGALLVGYEKEQRTLLWLRSLPIPAGRVIGVKLATALAGLVVLWTLSNLFSWTVLRNAGPEFRDHVGSGSMLLSTVYVLLAGFALAWWCRSALVALLLVVPVALLPLAATNLILAISAWARWHWPDNAIFQLLVCSQAVGAVVAFAAAVSLGRRYMAAQLPSGGWRVLSWPLLDRYRTARQRAGYAAVASPASALLWQFARQNRAVLCGLLLLLAATVLPAAASQLNDAKSAWGALGMILATSWLGVVVFQGDSIGQRVRFLADRGISPATLWWTRQLVPAAILAVALLVGLGVIWCLADARTSLVDIAPLTLVAIFVLVGVYAVSQWAGQLMESPILAAIGAPILSLLAFAWGSFAVTSLGAPIALMAGLAIVPIIATRWMTRRWMDRRMGAGGWASHGGFLSLVILVPLVPPAVDVAWQPRMPRQVAEQLEATARSAAPLGALVELTPGSRLPPSAGIDQRIQRIRSQLDERGGPVHVSSARGVILPLQGAATLLRLSLAEDDAAGSSPEGAGDGAFGWSPAEREANRKRYRELIELVSTIAIRMRQSPRVIEQDAADLLEIWLLMELSSDQAGDLLGPSLFRQVADHLADASARNVARKRAIAHSWRSFQQALERNRRTPDFGGYNVSQFFQGDGDLRSQLLGKRRVGLAVAELWELAAGGPQAASPQRLTAIARAWGHAPGHYGVGGTARGARADDPQLFFYPSGERWTLRIAGQWHAGWERRAAELRDRF